MSNKLLKTYVENALNATIDPRTTAASLASHMRLLVSLHDCIADSYALRRGMRHDMYRAAVTERLYALYDLCAKRIHSDARTAAALLPAMFDIVAMPSEPLDNRMYQECDDMAAAFLEKALAQRVETDRHTEHAALRIIIELAGQTDASDRKKDDFHTYLLGQIDAWAKTLSADGTWYGLSVTETLSRLEVMNRCSFKLSFSRYDSLIAQSLRRCRDIAAWDTEALTLGMALAANAPQGIDMPIIEAIAEQAAKRLPAAQPDGDECRDLCALLLDGIYYRSWSDAETATVA